MLLQLVDVTATAALIGDVDPRWILLPLAALVGQFMLRAARWSLVLSAAAGTHVSVRRIVGPLAVGYLGNAVLPARLGEVARALLVSQRERLEVGTVAASVVVERTLDLVALLGIGVLATGSISAVGLASVVVTAAIVLVLGVLASAAPAISRRLPTRGPARVHTLINQFLAGVSSLGLRAACAGLVLSGAAWAGDIAIIWACAQAIGVELAIPAAIAIAVGAVLGTALPASGGYVGTYELGAVALGSLAGVAPDTILAVAVLAHVLAVVPVALFGAIAAMRMGVSAHATSVGRPTVTAEVRPS